MRTNTMSIEFVAFRIIGAALSTHSVLGPGLPKAKYVEFLEQELYRRGLQVESQKVLPLVYNGARTRTGYRVDFVVNEEVVVEVSERKDVGRDELIQMQTYLKLVNCRTGLLLNFHARWMKNGIYRITPRGPSRYVHTL